MSKFEIKTNTDIFTVEADSEEEARKLVEEQINTLPKLTPTGLSPLQQAGEAIKTALKAGVPYTDILGQAKTVSQVITTPQRGTRGLGVGAERLLENTNPTNLLPSAINPLANPLKEIPQMVKNAPNALERAAEAVKPGFQPQEGEKLGAFAGEALGSMPLATAVGAPFAALGRAKILASILKSNPKLVYTALQAASGAAQGATLSAIQQASENGDVELDDVETVAGIGALISIIKPIGNVLTRYLKSFARDTVVGTTSVSKEAAEEVVSNPKLLQQARGEAEAVAQRAVRIQRVLKHQLDEAGTKLAGARESFGIEKNFEEWLEDTMKKGLSHKSDKEVAREFAELMAGKRIQEVPAIVLRDGLITKTTKNVVEDIPYKERVRDMYRLRKEINEYVNWSKVRQDVPPVGTFDETQFKNMRHRINDQLNDFAKSDSKVKALRDTDDLFSLGRELYDGLQQKLATEGKAEQVLLRIAKGESPDSILGLTKDVVDLIRNLEKSSRIKLIEPLRKEILVKSIRDVRAKPTGFFTTMIGPGFEAIGPEGTGRYLGTAGRFSSLMDRILEVATNPTARAAIIAGTVSKKK